jgi:hypothetical protein
MSSKVADPDPLQEGMMVDYLPYFSYSFFFFSSSDSSFLTLPPPLSIFFLSLPSFPPPMSARAQWGWSPPQVRPGHQYIATDMMCGCVSGEKTELYQHMMLGTQRLADKRSEAKKPRCCLVHEM